jgi:hypothetical protein
VRRRPSESEQEDITLLAGWMYADLLLGLMVIFLATISFVPLNNYVSKSLVKADYKQTDKALNFNRGISLVYKQFDAVSLEKDIEAFKRRESMDKDSEIIFVQILGGYDAATENQEIGRNRALIYSFKLAQDSPGLFASAAVTAGGDPKIKSDEIGLRLTFASKIKK